MIMIFGQQATYGLDSAIPGTSNQESEIDERIYNIVPDILRFDGLGFSILDSSTYDGRWYLGSFGSSFNDNGWNAAYEWLANQGADLAYSEKPAFVSWWDYGFQALSTGEHPSVSDNFQSGIPATGNMLLARTQDDLTAMFIWQLAEGDRVYATEGDQHQFTPAFENTVDKYLSTEQMNEFMTMQLTFDESMIEFIEERSFNVVKSNRNVVLAEVTPMSPVFLTITRSTRFTKTVKPFLVLMRFPVPVWAILGSMEQADITFNNNVRTSEETVEGRSHTIFGDYWYTDDLLDEYLSVSTSIHRKNARLALTTQLLRPLLMPTRTTSFTTFTTTSSILTVRTGSKTTKEPLVKPSPETTKFVTSPSTTVSTHTPVATRRTPITTVVNPWGSLVHQPSCLDKMSPLT